MNEVVNDRFVEFRRLAQDYDIATTHISELEADVVVGIFGIGGMGSKRTRSGSNGSVGEEDVGSTVSFDFFC